MSKSLKRVVAALDAAGIDVVPMEMAAETRTAQQAADAAGCALDQIAKSIVFQGAASGEIVLFLTAGGNQIDPAKASALAGMALGRADADAVRAHTGFAIGGVSPVGHLNSVRCFMDPRLLEFDRIFAAAGTPRHIFPIAPQTLRQITSATVSAFTA